MKYLFLLTVILIIPFVSFAQLDDNGKAKLYFQEAHAKFNQNEYEEAILYLDKTENTLGSTNGRILNLKIKTLYNMGRFLEAEKALNVFIEQYSETVTTELKDETLAYFVKIEKAADAKRATPEGKFITLLDRVKRLGDAKDQYELYLKYKDGDGTKYDRDSAYYWLDKAAAQGYSKAQYSQGIRYVANKNYTKGFEWYTKAANQGHIGAITAKAIVYYTYIIPTQTPPYDTAEVMRLFTQAIEKNSNYAQLALGILYSHYSHEYLEKIKVFFLINHEIHIFPKDYTKATYWLEKAAESTNNKIKDPAAIMLSKLYQDVDVVKAVAWLEYVTTKYPDNLEMCFDLAKAYEKYYDKFGGDYKKAISQYEKTVNLSISKNKLYYFNITAWQEAMIDKLNKRK